MNKAIPPGGLLRCHKGIAGSGEKSAYGLTHVRDADGKLFGNGRTQNQEAKA